MTVRPDLLSMTRDEAEQYLAYVKRAGPRGTPLSPEALAEAEELCEVLAKADPRVASVERASAEAEAISESLYVDGSLALESAELYAKSGSEPSLPPRRYEDAMLALAERERLPRETAEKCFARLGREGWNTPAGEKVALLAQAAQRARALLAKKAGDLARATAPDRLAKKADLESQLAAYVRSQVRPGETPERCEARLMKSGDAHYTESVLRIRGIG